MEKMNNKPLKEEHCSKINSSTTSSSRLVWDCGSSLYDSCELQSFQRQLDSAIKRQLDSAIVSSSSSRTNSMPRLSSDHHPTRRHPNHQAHHLPQQPSAASSPAGGAKKSKISRSLHKFLRSVFRRPRTVPCTVLDVDEHSSKDRVYTVDCNCLPASKNIVVDHHDQLPTIHEMGSSNDYLGFSSDAVVRKTVSERFTRTSMISVSCA